MPMNRPLPNFVGFSSSVRDDAARAGHERHADEQAFAELRGFLVVRVEGVDRPQQRVDGRGHGRVRHDESQRGRDEKAAEVDHAGALARRDQHAISHAPREARLRKDHAERDRADDEPHRGVHEIAERGLRAFRGILGSDQEQDLDHPDGNAGHADRYHLEDPPGRGQQKEAQRGLALVRQRYRHAPGIGESRKGRAEVDNAEQQHPDEHPEVLVPVDPPGLDLHADSGRGSRWACVVVFRLLLAHRRARPPRTP
jgi:hypothetical protein